VPTVHSHAPDARSGSGTLTIDYGNAVGLLVGIPVTPFAVDAQRGGTTRLPSATARPHL